MIDYAVICFVATTLGAVSGIGGGVIIKPVMDAVSGLPVLTINFLSGCAVLAMSAVSLLRGRKDSAKVEAKESTFLGLGAMLGGIAGKAVLELLKQLALSDRAVGFIQNALMIILIAGVFLFLRHKSRVRALRVKNPALCALVGFWLGGISGFLGIGGGPINLVVLYYFFSMDAKTAALNSIYVILLSQAASLVHMLQQQSVPAFGWPALVSMVIGGIVGGFVGSGCRRKMSGKQVETVFYFLLFAILGICLYNVMNHWLAFRWERVAMSFPR